jgi:hypothetical protein
MRIVEISGLKYEIDERNIKLIENFKIGDRIKVLHKKYQDTFVIYPGVIIGFCDFKDLPTIEVLFLESEYGTPSFKIIGVNAKSGGDYQIAAITDEELMIDKQDIVNKFDAEIKVSKAKIEDLTIKKKYFIERFAAAFPTKEAVQKQ